MTVTNSEVRSDHPERVPEADSPAVRAGARAKIQVTHSEIKLGDRIRVGLSSWWLLTAEPMTLRALWTASAVDAKRIPLNNGLLRGLWHVSNWTDRLAVFALLAITPTFLTGPLRWCAVRPTRRYSLYLTLAALTGAYLYGRKY
ncbi:hypothetical protein Ade02nite_20030 [Paractinoplanes deccanensis]|uniref:Uncharacterized protein n=1 Tax=Paractinoplanes deccanensis TaxID=113561 RepID=A0ABQ3Y056_9ACTN|nr:hypothetical protein [Actinoplanes deccanensis]GID73362.1 hypothetical protein Ade02nite_20030 [Actinoplanes deccanensis]